MKTTSRIPLRRSLASVVAAALLVAVLALSLASPAPAQARTGISVWSGTLTAGVYIPDTAFGFVPELDVGSLDDTTFSHGGANHTIDGIGEQRPTVILPNILQFSLADAGLGDVSDLALHVGGKSFDFSDATFNSTNSTYTWTDPALGWSDGDTVFLEIIEEVSPELSLVSNPKDNGDGTVAILHEKVQGFTTGPNPYGYELSNVRIAFHAQGLPSTYQPQHMEVRIRADNGGVPGTAIHTMTNPSSLSPNFETFDAPAEARLDPDTTYFVSVRYGTNNVRVQSTTLDTEYASGSGWTIANHALDYAGIEQTWTPVSGSKAILLQISGRAFLPPPLPPEGAIWSGTMTVGLLSVREFGYVPEVDVGSLDDTTFFHNGATHTIDGIVETRGELNSTNKLEFNLAGAGLGDVSGLALHVGGKSFDFSDATFDSTEFHYTWTDPGLGWSTGDTVSLEIVNDAPPELWSAVMTVSGSDGHKVYGYTHWPPSKRVPRATTIGAITDGDLEYDGATHIVTEVKNFRRDDGNDLRFTTETTEGGGLGDVSDLRLVVDGYERPFSDARRVGARTYIWDNTPGLAWSDGDTVSLSIIQRVGLPTAPPSLKAVGGLGLAALSWPAPEDDGNRPITGYEVRYALSGEAYPDAWTPAPGGYHDRDRTAVVEGLEAGTEYTFEVRARNKMGAGPAAESATARTADAGATAQSAARAVLYPRSALDPDQTGQYLLVDWRDEDAQGRPLCATGYDVYILLGEWGWLESGDPIAVDPGHSTRNMPPLGTFRHHGSYGSDVTEEQVRVVCDDGDGRLIGEVTARRGTALPPWGGTGNQGALLPEVTLTTTETAAAEEGAALEFTLTRTGPTEEALGVNLSVSETGAMVAAYPASVEIPAGQDSAAFSVLTVDDEAVEADSVVTAALAEDAERYTVGAPFSASVTVMDDDRAPLTAEFLDAPESHNGEDAFTVRIAFSEAVAASYRTLRDLALEVTGGRVREAKRVDGRSDLWRITIEPDSDAEVTVVLPVTGSCDAEGAICTGDGGALSNRVELTVPGPVAEEEDAQAQEQQQEEERTPPENSAATGAPAITGTARVGETLTADTSGIADADGLDNAAFSYQWLAGGADIQGATGSTYTLQDADEGKAVTVRVSFDDDAGNQETLTSGATAGVEAAVAEEEPVEPPPAPTNLTAVVNEDGSVTLTWDAPDDDSVTGYLILRRRPYEGEKTLLVYVENTGSTATVYTDADVTAGTQHVYRVKAINEAGVGGQSNYVNADVPDAEADDSASSDEPKPPSREEVPDSDPEAEQQSGRAENPRGPELVDSILGRIRIRLFPVEGATRYEVTRIKLLRTGHAVEDKYTRSIQHSDAPIYTDHDIEWGRRYIYYYRARFGNSSGSYSNGSVKVTSEEEPHVTNRRIVRTKKSAGLNNFIWRLSYRWNAPTEDAVGTLLGYTVEQWYNGRVTVTELGPRSTRWDGGFAAAPGSGLGTQYRIKVRYSTGETAWSPYTISCVDESKCATTSYEEVGGYETS